MFLNLNIRIDDRVDFSRQSDLNFGGTLLRLFDRIDEIETDRDNVSEFIDNVVDTGNDLVESLDTGRISFSLNLTTSGIEDAIDDVLGEDAFEGEPEDIFDDLLTLAEDIFDAFDSNGEDGNAFEDVSIAGDIDLDISIPDVLDDFVFAESFALTFFG